LIARGLITRVQIARVLRSRPDRSARRCLRAILVGSMSLPFDGILVADFSRAVAGPFCTMMLGDLGARIIKVEGPGSGDETRRWGPPFAGEWSAYFLSVNRNKESLALDLKSPVGKAAAQELVRRADVVVENFRPGAMARLGLGYDEVSRANPRVVYASISGYGQDQPRGGYDIIVQGESGSMYLNGTEATGPVKTAFPVADILTGQFAMGAISSALYARERDGKGRYVEISLMESMLAAMTNLATGCLMSGQEPERVGAAQPSIVPYQAFACSDGHIIVGAPNNHLFREFSLALGHEEWSADARFADNPARNANRQALVALVEAVMHTNTVAHWRAEFDKREVPCGPVNTMSQMLAEPLVAARAMVVEIPMGDGIVLRTPANPMRFAGDSPRTRPAPRLGEHTEALLAELGVSAK
jgi:crotonobetainyl-CoA:carnitine CoA-transferase CaiB-like acyl-CoA transferase